MRAGGGSRTCATRSTSAGSRGRAWWRTWTGQGASVPVASCCRGRGGRCSLASSFGCEGFNGGNREPGTGNRVGEGQREAAPSFAEERIPVLQKVTRRTQRFRRPAFPGSRFPLHPSLPKRHF